MTKEEIELQARLLANEYALGFLISRMYLMSGATDEQIAQAQHAGAATLAQTTLPGVDAALADHFTAEITENIERIFTIGREMRQTIVDQLRNAT